MENSQLDAKISGMEVKLGQKRDSILVQTSELKNEVKDQSSKVQVTPAKVRCFQIGVMESNPLIFCSRMSGTGCKFLIKINKML